MDVEQIALRVNPKSFTLRRRRNVFNLCRGDELVRFHAGNQPADVQVDVALRLDARRIVGNGPFLAEQLFGFVDGRGKKIGARLVIQQFNGPFVGPGQREPTIRLARIGVLQDEDLDAGRLFFRFPAQAALANLQRLRPRGIAGAAHDVAAHNPSHKHRGDQETAHQFDYRAAPASVSLYWELLSETPWKRWTIVLALAGALFFLYFFGLTRTGLLGPDEPRYAAIGRAMAETGDWVTPRLWGKSWFEKPPLLYWMTAAAFKTGLDQDLAPRLPVALLSVAFLIYFFIALRREFDERVAFYATTILAMSAGWLAYSHVAVTDLPMSAAFSAAMLIVLRPRDAWGYPINTQPDPRSTTAATPATTAPSVSAGTIWAGVLLGLAILAKGLVPLALFLPAVWFMRKRIRELFTILAAATVIAAPWYALVTFRNGMPFLQEFFGRHHFARFASTTLGHERPFWFYLPVLLAGLFPWTPFLALLFQKRIYRDHRAVFLLAWFAWGFVFFSVFLNKLPGYLLPLLPAVAALLGLAIAGAEERSTKMVALIAASAALLWCIPAIQDLLPQALLYGASRARIHLPLLWVAPAVAVTALCALLERTRHRACAVALIGFVTAVSVIRLVWHVYPVLDHGYSVREVWISNSESITCVSNENRSQRYGLNYYARRDLPDCN